MHQPPTNICPLFAIASIGTHGVGQPVCIENRCALWHGEYVTKDISFGSCALVSIAEALKEREA